MPSIDTKFMNKVGALLILLVVNEIASPKLMLIYPNRGIFIVLYFFFRYIIVLYILFLSVLYVREKMKDFDKKYR